MSEGNDIIRRLTEGDGSPQEVDRHNIIVRQAPGPNPPDLLQQIIAEIKDSLGELTPIAGKAAGKYIEAKGDQAVARVQEIRARIYKSLAKLEIERQRLVQQRDQAFDSHIQRMMELKSAALKQIVDCVVTLKDKGIRIEMKVVRKEIAEAITGLLKAGGL